MLLWLLVSSDLVVCEIGESMEFACCKVLTPPLAPLLLLLLSPMPLL